MGSASGPIRKTGGGRGVLSVSSPIQKAGVILASGPIREVGRVGWGFIINFGFYGLRGNTLWAGNCI